jgi:phosphoribosyl-AMP cyclohydrolase
MLMNFKWNSDGLIPAIVQDAASRRVLMMAWMNAESLQATLATGEMHFWSRSRRELWHKGGTSGHTQRVVRWFADCDRDALLFEVEQTGGACHTGYESCFFQELNGNAEPLPVNESPVFDPATKYK